MHIVDICEVAYIVLRSFIHFILLYFIISFHFILKTFASKSSNPSPSSSLMCLQPQAMETETQNNEPGGLLEWIFFKTTHLCLVHLWTKLKHFVRASRIICLE